MSKETESAQRGINKLIDESLPGFLEDNSASLTGWIRAYVGIVTRYEEGAVDFQAGKVIKMFEQAGYTETSQKDARYEDANAIRNTLIALKKGEMPNPFTLTDGPESGGSPKAVQARPKKAEVMKPR